MPEQLTKPSAFVNSFQKLIRSFGYAFKGIKYATVTQLNFRVHIVATITALFMGYWLHISSAEWCWIVLCIALVMGFELMNTAIETLTDLVSPGYHPLAGRAKDVSAGAVVITAAFAVVVGLIIFLPKLQILIAHAA